MGHAQPPTTIKTDNSTAVGYVQKTIQQKKSKAWDMELHWLREKTNQEQFNVLWEKGKLNGADYFTKVTHPTIHHKSMRSNYIQDQVAQLPTTPKLNIINSSYDCKGVLVPDISGTRIQSQDMADVSKTSQDTGMMSSDTTCKSRCTFGELAVPVPTLARLAVWIKSNELRSSSS